VTSAKRFTDREKCFTGALPSTVSAYLQMTNAASMSAMLRPIFERIEALAPGVLAAAADEDDSYTRARALDSSSPEQRLADGILEAIDSKMDLVRLSLHAPRGMDQDLAPCMSAYAGEVAGKGAGHGAWLAIDVRDDGSEHAYGIASHDPQTRGELIDRWCTITGASRSAHRGPKALRTISGSHHWAMTGSTTVVRQNLTAVIEYTLHKLPGGAVRDPDTDVVATGALEGPWSAFRASGEGPGRPDPQKHFPGYAQSVAPRACEVCGGSLAGMKKNARTCRTSTCRVKKHRAKKAGQR
jgi:hypothetical protein